MFLKHERSRIRQKSLVKYSTIPSFEQEDFFQHRYILKILGEVATYRTKKARWMHTYIRVFRYIYMDVYIYI